MTPRPRRFCMITTFYPPYNFGGDGIAVRRLAITLAEQGHHVEVIHCGDAFNLLRPAGSVIADDYSDHPCIVHHRLDSKAGFLSPLITQQTGRAGLKGPEIRRIVSAGRFDVVHLHNPSLMGIVDLGKFGGVTLYTLHEHWLACPMHTLWRYNREACDAKRCIRCQIRGRRPPQLWRYTGSLQRSLRSVNAFIAPSLFTISKHREFGVEFESRVEHIPNFLPPPTPVVNDDPSPHDRPYFLFVGRLERLKGAHVLVDAFTRYDKADLLIAGAGHDQETLRSQAAGFPHIHFLGHTPYSRLETLMRHAVAVVVPSVGYEVFPTTVLEANAQGTPVIGHRFGPLPEMLDERGGLTYGSEAELIAAMEALRFNPALRHSLGERGRAEYLAEWTPEHHMRRYFALIDSLEPGAVLSK